MTISRRSVLGGMATGSSLALLGGQAFAADNIYKIGVTLPLTGADASAARLILNAVLLGIKTANDTGELKGVKLEALVLNNATSTAGQYDPAQAATNARKLVGDSKVLVNIGPEMSGSGKAMAPILSMGMLATITPSSTNPSITNPAMAAEFDPGGKPIYFRTVTTDAYQAPGMANYYAEVLKLKSVYILDDSGAYGVGLADAFEAQAKKKGLTVLGRDRLDPKASDYTGIVTKIKSTGAASLYYGGVSQAGVKLIKQSYAIVPGIVKAGGDGIDGAEMVTAAGFPAVQDWYFTTASPYLVGNKNLENWSDIYTKTYGIQPSNYAVTGYDATMVAIAAIRAVINSGKALNRRTVRDAIQAVNIDALQGPISFDKNGDLTNHTVSVFQFRYNKAFPATDFANQFTYIGVAPQD